MFQPNLQMRGGFTTVAIEPIDQTPTYWVNAEDDAEKTAQIEADLKAFFYTWPEGDHANMRVMYIREVDENGAARWAMAVV